MSVDMISQRGMPVLGAEGVYHDSLLAWNNHVCPSTIAMEASTNMKVPPLDDTLGMLFIGGIVSSM